MLYLNLVINSISVFSVCSDGSVSFLYQANYSGDAKQSLVLSTKALEGVRCIAEDSLPNKQQFVSLLHSHIGNAHMDLGSVDKAMEHFKKELEIAETE